MYEIGECDDTCCDYLVIIINGFDDILSNCSIASQFHMYIFINIKQDENLDGIKICLENFIIFQAIRNAPKIFTIYERKRNGIERISLWDGNYFVDNHFKRHKNLVRNFEGEVLRVGTGPMMPASHIWTFKDGSQFVGSGNFHEYLRLIASMDDILLKWVDVYYEEGPVYSRFINQ